MSKKNFTRKDLAIKLYQNVGFSKNFSSSIVDNFFETIIQELIKSNMIKISIMSHDHCLLNFLNL